MRNLNWRAGLRRGAIFTVVWLILVYVASVALPQYFGLNLPEQLPALAVNVVAFFVLFTIFSAYTEKRRAQRQAELRAAKKGKSTGKTARRNDEDEGAEPGRLKGQYNPNTSRKKARRRR